MLFDVDGTLVDSLQVIIQGLGDAYEHFNGVRPPDDQIQALIGMPLRKQLQLFREEEAAADELREMMDYTIERFESNSHLESMFEPAIETLKLAHRAGLKVALVTSKSDIELELLLKRFGPREFVDETVHASEVVDPKPAPEAALLACRKLGVEPSSALFIGDSVFDIQCAKAAGLRSVAVAYGSGLEQDLRRENPDLLFTRPEDLHRWATETLLTTSCPERK